MRHCSDVRYGLNFPPSVLLRVFSTFVTILSLHHRFLEVLTLERHSVAEVVVDYPEDLYVLTRARNFYMLKHAMIRWAQEERLKRGVRVCVFNARLCQALAS